MTDAPDKESKTEEPTEKKLQDALDRGNVPVSREAAVFASIAAGAITLRLLVPMGGPQVAALLATQFDTASQWRLDAASDAIALLLALLLPVALLVAPLFVLHAAMGVAASALQNPPSLNTQRIAPQWSRMSPAGNWSRMFGPAGHLELLKSTLKLLGFGLVAFLYMRARQHVLADSIYEDVATLPQRMVSLGAGLAEAMATAAAVLLAIDLILTRMRWHSEQKMTKTEVKKEMKESQGDPIVRSRLRSVALARSRRRMMADVPRATLIIANPTHFAIALRYVRGENAAPKVLAKGQDLIALAIREIAEAHSIPVMEDKALARSMYHQVEIDRIIPPAFYKAVAEIIHLLSAKRSRAPTHSDQG